MTSKVPLALAAAFALLLGATTGCGASSSPTATVTPPGSAQPTEPAPNTSPTGPAPLPTSFNAAVGATLTASSDDGATVKATVKSVKTFTKACRSDGDKPEHGQYIVVDLTVEQVQGEAWASMEGFQFVADDGTTADALGATFSGCAVPALDSAQLRAGQKRAGKIIFDTPAKSGAIEWSPFLRASVGSWKVTS